MLSDAFMHHKSVFLAIYMLHIGVGVRTLHISMLHLGVGVRTLHIYMLHLGVGVRTLHIYMLHLGVGVRALHISRTHTLWHISNIIIILITKLYTVKGSLEIDFSVFITQSFNFGCVFCLDLELLHCMMHYSWVNQAVLLSA